MFRKQPRIDIKPNTFDKKLIRVGWVLVITNFMIVIAFYFDLPDVVAIHFDLKGNPNGYGNKDNLLILPIINLGIYYLMTQVITKIKPWNYNYPTEVTESNAPKLYAMSIRMMIWLNLSIAFTFLYISIQVIALAYGAEKFTPSWFIAVLVGIITLLPLVFVFKMFKVSK
jgi:uncharacterized membrane protein